MIRDYERYIFFSDLHSNYYALKSFYEYIQEINKEVRLFFLGDLVGYYDFDSRIIELFYKLLKEHKLTLILGNHDARFLNLYFGMSYPVNCSIPFSGKITKDSGIRYEIQKLLQLAKITESTMIFNRKTRISHGGISDPLNTYCYPDLKFLEDTSYKYEPGTDYIFGHSHYCFTYKDTEKDNTFMNVGSIGMPRNKSVYGNILELEADVIEIKNISYNLDLQFEANKNLPKEIKNRVYLGGNSTFIKEELVSFNNWEKDRIRKLPVDRTVFDRMILIGAGTRILKTKDKYLLALENSEKQYKDLEILLRELAYEI